jgi:hypothetical protein
MRHILHGLKIRIFCTMYYAFREMFGVEDDYFPESINRFVFVIETQCVFSASGIESLNIV